MQRVRFLFPNLRQLRILSSTIIFDFVPDSCSLQYTYEKFFKDLAPVRMLYLTRDYWLFENYIHMFGNSQIRDVLPYFQTHNIIFLMALFSVILIIILQLISYVLSVETHSVEKKSSYECGFEPFGEAHTPINIHFYLIGILYLIFDLELLFFYPWFLASTITSIVSYWTFLEFLVLVGAGFLYEWKQGGLKWHR